MEIVGFDFKGQQIRTVEEDGEIYFVARDVCDVLGYEHITNTLDKLDEDELTVKNLQSGGQMREMKLVTESGLYTLIVHSNKENAKPFRRWITHEVLPTIRKTGSYTVDFEEFGKVPFQTEALEGSVTGQNIKTYYLNEQQATLLMTYLRNTPVVRMFKKALVREFFELRRESCSGNYSHHNSFLTSPAIVSKLFDFL